ncbi:MAG: hypothetical protein ACI9TV_003264 [Sulfurimonas sp.]|jgi:hypothetical protein|uniref:hypothetical protein n=1 Tax=Sulfurimonas sp. TaxID=2022749 RepID=UPI0039E68E11
MTPIENTYPKKDYPYVVIQKRPTDEDIILVQTKSEDFKKQQKEYIYPSLTSCKEANRKYTDSGIDLGMFPPFILTPITKETKRFLDYNYSFDGRYKGLGDSYYVIVENKF